MCVKSGELWEKFVEWARDHGIEFRHQEDYEMLWKCFYDATNMALASHKDEKIEVV